MVFVRALGPMNGSDHPAAVRCHPLIRSGRGSPLQVITTARTSRTSPRLSPWSTASRSSRAAPPTPAPIPKLRSASRATNPSPTGRTAQTPDPVGHLPHGRLEHPGHRKAPLRRRVDLRPAPPIQTARRQWEHHTELHGAFLHLAAASSAGDASARPHNARVTSFSLVTRLSAARRMKGDVRSVQSSHERGKGGAPFLWFPTRPTGFA